MRALMLFLAACSVEAETPRSLLGTEVDGALVAESGRFLFDEGAQQAFDYFLTASGEIDDGALDAWVARELEARLPEEALESGLAAWRDYTAYRREAAAVLERGFDEAQLLAAIETHLGAHPIASSERARIMRVRAPEPLDGPALHFIAARKAVAFARSTGASEAEIYAIRARHFGEAAAARLAALDAKRALR
jgi:lipase chaperone LimK